MLKTVLHNLFNDFLSIFGNLNVFGNNLNEASTDMSVRKEAGESFFANSNKQNDLKNPMTYIIMHK